MDSEKIFKVNEQTVTAFNLEDASVKEDVLKELAIKGVFGEESSKYKVTLNPYNQREMDICVADAKENNNPMCEFVKINGDYYRVWLLTTDGNGRLRSDTSDKFLHEKVREISHFLTTMTEDSMMYERHEDYSIEWYN